MTVFIIFIDVAMYLIFNIALMGMGKDYFSYLVNNWVAIRSNGEYYRLLTSMFLHFDATHLLNNMLVLFAVGSRYEHNEGKLRFLIIYFLGGIIASISSLSYNMLQVAQVSSMGASGAVFAVVGGLAASVVKSRDRLRNISKRQIIIFIALSLYLGFADTSTDNAAHIGGLIAGFLIGFIISKRNYRGMI